MCEKLLQDKNSIKEKIQALQKNLESTENEERSYRSKIRELGDKANTNQEKQLKELFSTALYTPLIIFIPGLILQLFAGPNIAVAVFNMIWAGAVILKINEILSSTYARSEKDRLRSFIDNILSKSETLRSRKSDLEKQLYVIENKMRENKCN